MNKHEICVHIKDDEMLQKAKELLEKHGEKVCTHPGLFKINTAEGKINFLIYETVLSGWIVGLSTREILNGLNITEITLEILDDILATKWRP